MPKLSAICLGDLGRAVERSLLGNRALSSAGLGLNSSAAQTVTITVGAKQTDDVLTVTVNGTAYEYTVLVGDADNAAVATALAALIDASAIVAAAAVGAVITVTASDAAVGFILSAAVTGTDHATTLAVETTQVSVQAVATANTLQFCVDGVVGSKAATVDIAVGGAVLPVSSSRWYLLSVAADGTLTTTPGDNNINALPPIPAGTAPCGAFKVATDATHAFTPGVTSLNDTGITTTFYNLSVVPTAGHP